MLLITSRPGTPRVENGPQRPALTDPLHGSQGLATQHETPGGSSQAGKDRVCTQKHPPGGQTAPAHQGPFPAVMLLAQEAASAVQAALEAEAPALCRSDSDAQPACWPQRGECWRACGKRASGSGRKLPYCFTSSLRLYPSPGKAVTPAWSRQGKHPRAPCPHTVPVA